MKCYMLLYRHATLEGAVWIWIATFSYQDYFVCRDVLKHLRITGDKHAMLEYEMIFWQEVSDAPTHR